VGVGHLCGEIQPKVLVVWYVLVSQA
jgi:hypothetical protein